MNCFFKKFLIIIFFLPGDMYYVLHSRSVGQTIEFHSYNLTTGKKFGIGVVRTSLV